MTQDEIIAIAIQANIYKKMGGINFNLAMTPEKLTKYTELILASKSQLTPSQTNCYAGLKAVSYACPQDFIDYKNSYTVSETKTNFYNVPLYTQDQVDYILQSQLYMPQPTSQDAIDAERWRYYVETCSGEAAFELTGITDASNEQINAAIDAKIKESK